MLLRSWLALSSNKTLVTPAQAGVHPLTVRFELRVRGMDSRLRGNDELG
jgi:hypothetical protein